jgi:methyl-accepting chemotaxis protein
MFKLSIAKKISYGFGVILLLVVVGVGMSGLGISSVTTQFSDLVGREFAAVRHVSNAKIALLEARRPEKDLLYADDPTLVKASNGFVETLIKESAATEAVLQEHAEKALLDEVKAISTQTVAYQKQFGAMVGAAVGQERMVAALAVRKTAKELEAHLNNVLEIINKQIAAETAAAKTHAATTIGTSVVAGGFALILGVLVAIAIFRAVVRPLERMKKTIMEVQSTGNFSIKVDYREDDEVGQAAQAFDALMAELQRTIGEVQQSSVAIAAAAREMAASGAQVTQGSAAQSEAAAAVAAAVEETSVSISETASKAKTADQIVQQAQVGIDRAMTGMRETVANVESVAGMIRNAGENVAHLDESSKKIGGIVKVIKDIADQTNLLALNAAIEAARAGETGRGFAVVADEVRKLAESTTTATNEIAGLIGGIQAEVESAVTKMREANVQTDHGLELVERAETNLQKVGSDSANVVENVRAIANAMVEQDIAVHQVASSIEHIAQITDENNEAARSAAGTAKRLDDLAVRLRTSVERFKT